MTLDTYIRAQMARFAIEEGARHGGTRNMLAIAYVLRNRVFAGWGDWVQVVQRAGEKRANAANGWVVAEIPNLRHPDVRILLNQIDAIYTQADVQDLTGGALFYVEPNLPMAPWFKTEVLNRSEDHPRCAHIGPVWFFK